MRKKNILKVILWVALISTVCGCAVEREQCNSKEWVSLFNGKNLAGWRPKISGYEFGKNFGNTFRVEDGILKVSYDEYDEFDGEFGHLFYKDKFSHYRLRLEYRFVGEQLPGGPGWGYRNSGIMLHCQSPESMRKDQDFPVCIEAQLLGGDGTGERSTGNVCTPGMNIVMNDTLVTDHCINSSSKTYYGAQWVKAEVEVHGNDIVKHIINGHVVLEYKKPQFDPEDDNGVKLIEANDGELMVCEGYISVQAESHPVEFRNIEILLLEQ
jgi:hypothetical protein